MNLSTIVLKLDYCLRRMHIWLFNIIKPINVSCFIVTRKSIESFSKQLSELDKIVRRMVVEILGLKKYWDKHIDSTDYVIRVQKYEGPQSHEPKLGLLSHIDKNILTILCPNEVKGLEMLTKDGQWISADNSPNSFFVVAREAFLVSNSNCL